MKQIDEEKKKVWGCWVGIDSRDVSEKIGIIT